MQACVARRCYANIAFQCRLRTLATRTSLFNVPIKTLVLSNLSNIRQCLDVRLDAVSEIQSSSERGCTRKFADKSLEIVFSDGKEPICDELVRTSEIILAEPYLIQPHLKSATGLVWLQSAWTGNEDLLKEIEENDLKHIKLTRIGGIAGPIISEYCVGHIVSRERDFVGTRDAQRIKAWSKRHRKYRTLDELTIGIMGVGNIGLQIAKDLKGFGCTTLGLVRSPNGRNDSGIDEWFSTTDLSSYLKNCDYIINTLPGTSATRNLLSGDVLSNCKPECIFISVGCGDIIDDASLLDALKQNWISGAILDVFNTEPLPDDHFFWRHDSITITPHISGISFPRHVAKVFAQNLALFLDRKPLKFVMDVEKGY